MDPKGDLYTDLTACHKYCQMWQVFSTIFNREHGGNTWLPTSYSSTVFSRARQPVNDNNNCGIYTLMVCNNHIIVRIFFTPRRYVKCYCYGIFHSYYFSLSFLKFAKRYLEHADMSDIDPECHGPALAAEIVDCSSLTTECIKCIKKCDGSEPFRICEGSCSPARHFHM